MLKTDNLDEVLDELSNQPVRRKVQLVVILWGVQADPTMVHGLVYGDDSLRVYERDQYDARLALDGRVLPYIDNSRDAFAFILKHPDEQFQTTCEVAREFGFTEFGEVD